MLESHFIHAGKMIFRELQETYSLTLQISKDELVYHNSDVSFSIYFDRKLDIYICFNINNSNLYLHDLAKQLGFEDVITSIKQNQVSNIADIDRILNNLHAVIQRVLDIVKDNQKLLIQCFERQKAHEAKRLEVEKSNYLLHKLDVLWKEKQYEKFVYLFEENEDLLKGVPKLESIKKRVNYARKYLQGY